MSDLFISYSRRDQAFVRELHTALEKEGKDVWVDWENIPLTAEWLQEIYDGIEAGDAFAYVITPDSVRSEVCSLELAHALSHNKRLIPILRRELVEDMDKKALDPKISSHNWIYYRDTDDFDKAFHSLKDALNTDLEYLKTHTRLLIKAVEWNDKERDTGLVLRGNDLSLASQWLQQSADKEPVPTDLQREYVIASQRAATARFRAFALYAVYGVVVILLAGFALLQASNAEQRRVEAEEQRKVAEDNAAAARDAEATAVYNGDQARSLALASNAQQILYRDKNPELALALSLVANNSIANPPLLAQSALAQSAYFPGTRYVLDEGIKDASRLATDVERERVLFANRENALVLMDLNTREAIHTWPSPDAVDVIRSVAMTPDGQYAAAGYSGGQIRIYNTEDGSLFKEFIGEGSSFIWDMAISPDGQFLVTACDDGRARVWDWRTGTLALTFDDHVEVHEERGISATPNLFAIAVRPDSQAVLTIDASLGLLMLWDIKTGERLQTYEALNSAGDPIGAGWSVAFLPDGKSALVGYNNYVMRWIDLETLTVRRDFVGHSNIVWDIAVTPNGQEAVSSSYDNNIIHWNLSNGEILETFKGHNNVVYGVSMVDLRFVSGSSDGTLRYWDLASGAQIDRLSIEGAVSGIYPLGEGEEMTVVVGSYNGAVHMLDHTLTLQRTITTPEEMLGLDVSPTHDLLVTGAGGDEGRISIWRLSDGTLQKEEAFGFRIYDLSLAPDGEWIAFVGNSGDVGLWNWKTDERRAIPTATAAQIAAQRPLIRTVQFSLDGSQILTAGSGGISNDVFLFDFASGELDETYKGHSGSVYSVAFSPDGRYVASSSEDNSIIVWRIDQSEPPRSLYGHTDDVVAMRFSPDSRLIVSGSVDKTIRLWDIQTGSETQRFDTQSSLFSASVDAQSQTIFSGDTGGNLQRWQVRTLPDLLEWTEANRYIPELTCEQKNLYQITLSTCGT
jgi:WD40 repeat protein